MSPPTPDLASYPLERQRPLLGSMCMAIILTGVEEERIPLRNVLLGHPVMANTVSTKGENMLETHERHHR
jgi:hypothetical protein